MVDERVLWLIGMVATGAAVGLASKDSPSPAPLLPVASVAISSPIPDAKPLSFRKRVVLDRAPDGLFYIDGQVNGTSVRFLVDTGATALILSSEDAARAKLRSDDASNGSSLQTASGTSKMIWAEADTLEVGGRSFEAMPAAVTHGGLKVSLLGQSVLSKLGPILLDGDQMMIGSGPQ